MKFFFVVYILHHMYSNTFHFHQSVNFSGTYFPLQNYQESNKNFSFLLYSENSFCFWCSCMRFLGKREEIFHPGRIVFILFLQNLFLASWSHLLPVGKFVENREIYRNFLRNVNEVKFLCISMQFLNVFHRKSRIFLYLRF